MKAGKYPRVWPCGQGFMYRAVVNGTKLQKTGFKTAYSAYTACEASRKELANKLFLNIANY